MKPADVESLLAPQNRAGLPLAQQVHLYLDPFALFKDASQGPTPARERALSYNRAMRWVLVPYLRRWMAIAVLLFLCIAPAKAVAAVGCCIAVAVLVTIAAVYLLLGSSK